MLYSFCIYTFFSILVNSSFICTTKLKCQSYIVDGEGRLKIISTGFLSIHKIGFCTKLIKVYSTKWYFIRTFSFQFVYITPGCTELRGFLFLNFTQRRRGAMVFGFISRKDAEARRCEVGGDSEMDDFKLQALQLTLVHATFQAL